MSCQCRIKFTSEKPNKDYNHKLICTTDREKFLIDVIARGVRGALDLPDEFEFEEAVPVKYTQSKTILARNIGNTKASVTLSTDNPMFSVESKTEVLEPHEAFQLTVNFKSDTEGTQKGNLVVTYSTGEICHVKMIARAKAFSSIRLEKSAINFDKTFAGLQSRKTVRIYNNSKVLVDYKWCSESSSSSDAFNVDQNLKSLDNEKNKELESLLSGIGSDTDFKDKLAMLDRDFQARKIQKITADQLFSSNIYEIEPKSGEIWPGSFVETSVTFTPHSQIENFEDVAFLDIVGQPERLPLKLKGRGQSANLRFNGDEVNLGSLYLGSQHAFELVIENIGDIEGSFKIKNDFADTFQFSPDSGVLKPQECQAIHVSYRANVLGEFSNEFLTEIDGKSKPLKLEMKGCVVGPTFHASKNSVNFEEISYGFDHDQSLELVNTSDVPMTYNLRINHEEILVLQEDKILKEQEKAKVNLSWRPFHFGSLENCFLYVDVDNVGTGVLKLPVHGTVKIPTLKLSTPDYDCGHCFINHKKKVYVELVNTTQHLCANYQLIIPEYDGMRVLTQQETGFIGAGQAIPLDLEIIVKTPGKHSINVGILVEGSSTPCTAVNITAFGEGAVVHLNPSHAKIDFGQLKVLQEISKSILVINEAPIDARFTAKILNEKSVFKVSPTEGSLKAEQSTSLTITPYLDDCIEFNDSLEIEIEHAGVKIVQLSASGQGTSIVSEPNLLSEEGVQFGPCFAQRTTTRQFVLTNAGRRHQQLTWSTVGYRRAATDVERERAKEPVFTVSPQRMELKPGKSTTITISGNCEEVCHIVEYLSCHVIMGKNTSKELAMTVKVEADFIEPLMEISRQNIDFYQFVDDMSEPKYMKEILTCRNLTPLALEVCFVTALPFYVSQGFPGESPETSKTIEMQPDQVVDLEVGFLARFTGTQHSSSASAKLTIHYREHPHTDVLKLYGEVHFPNAVLVKAGDEYPTEVERLTRVPKVVFSPKTITIPPCFISTFVDFDYCFQGTDSVQFVDITNPGPEKIRYEFELTEYAHDPFLDHINYDPKTLNFEPDINQIFDVCPIFGFLQPNESQRVAVTFHAKPTIDAASHLICKIDRGPMYFMKITGKADIIKYELETECLDFGNVQYDKIHTRSITLTNTGNVPFNYACKEFEKLIPGVPFIHSKSGYLHAKESINLQVIFLPGQPQIFDSKVTIQIGYFPDKDIKVMANATFSRIMFDLPRNSDNAEWMDLVSEIRENFAESDDPSSVSNFSDIEVWLEAERRQVVKSSVENSHVLTAQDEEQTIQFDHSTSEIDITKVKRKLPKPSITEYVLDFGTVVIGEVRSHVFSINNTGVFPASFTIDHSSLENSGFIFDLDKVKSLPLNDNVDCKVTFDSTLAHHARKTVTNPICESFSEEILSSVNVNVVNGCQIKVLLKAVLTEPQIKINTDNVDFGPVSFGMCKVVTVQMRNPGLVTTNWSVSLPEDMKIFEVLPTNGVLEPDNYANVQIKFAPNFNPEMNESKSIADFDSSSAEKSYAMRINFVSQAATQRCSLYVKGRGLNTILDMTPALLEFQPILPFAPGSSIQVTATNKSANDVEFFSLDFDEQYRYEEKILKELPGWDENESLLLPPGDTLPQEIKTWYDQRQTSEDCEPLNNPVTESLANYLGLDLSEAGKRAHNRRGIAICVHGAPKSGKTQLSLALSKYYGAAILTLDDIIIEALTQRNSEAAKQAFNLCLEEARKLDEISENDERASTNTTNILNVDADKTVGSTPAKQNDSSKDALTTQDATKSSVSITTASTQYQTQRIMIDGIDIATVQLPEDLLVEIIDNRLQLSDCQCGIVIDSLDTMFASNYVETTRTICRAFNNRKNIFFINTMVSVKQYYNSLLAQKERAEEEAVIAKRKQKEYIESLDADEYEELPEKVRFEYEQEKLIKARERLATKRAKKAAAEAEKRRLQEEEEERKRIEEEAKNSKKKGKKAAPQQKVEEPVKSETDLEPSTPLDNSRSKNEKPVLETDNTVRVNNITIEDLVPAAVFAKFRKYEKTIRDVQHVLNFWHREKQILVKGLASEESAEPEKKEKTEKKVDKKAKGKGKDNKAKADESKEVQEDVIPEGTGVPFLEIHVFHEIEQDVRLSDTQLSIELGRKVLELTDSALLLRETKSRPDHYRVVFLR